MSNSRVCCCARPVVERDLQAAADFAGMAAAAENDGQKLSYCIITDIASSTDLAITDGTVYKPCSLGSFKAKYL